jgi:hypothetical protein
MRIVAICGGITDMQEVSRGLDESDPEPVEHRKMWLKELGHEICVFDVSGQEVTTYLSPDEIAILVKSGWEKKKARSAV